MISVEEAKNLIRQYTQKLKPKVLDLNEIVGLQLAKDIDSPIDLPPFNQSAMDGYAFNYDAWDKVSPLTVQGEVATGNTFNENILPNTAIRIFTGAAMPIGLDTVVIQEKVTRSENQITIIDDGIKQGLNVRLQGSHTSKNTKAINSGTKITPAVISFIASLGITKTLAIPKPTVSIIVTGNELISPGNELTNGKIYESNSYCLVAVLKEMGITARVEICKDDLHNIAQAIENGFKKSDMVLVTGGISVGDYDFALPALQLAKYEIIFHKIKQKPGKPLCFAHRDNKIAFALPGNPASVLTCFYEYVSESIFLQMGYQQNHAIKTKLPLAGSFAKKTGLTHFLKARIENNQVTILGAQESYKMDSYAISDCIAVVDETIEKLDVGELIEVHFIDRIIRNA